MIISNWYKQSQRGGEHSLNIQVGGNLTVHDIEAQKLDRSMSIGQLARFRDDITQAAHEWEQHMEDAQRFAVASDLLSNRESMLRSAKAIGRIVSGYREHRFLFDDQSVAKIDSLLEGLADQDQSAGAKSTEDGDGGMLRLVQAVHLINSKSEATLQRLRSISE